MTVRVRYLHGRPGPHPLHGRLAEAVGAEFDFIDFRMRWQDQRRSRLYTVISWLVCAATLPRKDETDVFLIDNLHFPPVLMKRLFLRSDQKVVVHLGSHTPYFLLSHRFSRVVEWLHLWALRNYDALICEGRMTDQIAHALLGEACPPTYETFIGSPRERAASLRRLSPELGSHTIVLIASGPGEFRMLYKGLDLMIDAVALHAERDPSVELNVIGEWDADVVRACMARIPAAARSRIKFRGRMNEIEPWLERASLCLHCARGDAFPTATIEAMTAGLVALVSEWTGTRQIVELVDPRLIAPLDAREIADRISWYFDLPSDERNRLSQASRSAAGGYTEESARAHYREVFERIRADLALSAAA
jgi:glycosyltransferase involved in cell wall biosynthesis